MRFRFFEISLMIIRDNFFCVFEIFDWISFAIWWIFHSFDFILQLFINRSICQSWVNDVFYVEFLFVVNHDWWWWRYDLFEKKFWRSFFSNDVWNIECKFMSFEKSSLYEFFRFFRILNDFSILWFSFLDDQSICLFMLNNQTRFSTW
jgi:hypothetical protein